MASGWTNSGIDWTSAATMRESRTEDIVRHIYLAVNERDYWIRYFTTGFKFTQFNDLDLPSLDRDGRIRTEQATRYIYNTVKDWLTPFDNLTPVNNDLYLTNQSCFLDDNSSMDPDEITGLDYQTFLPSGRWFGLKNMDYSQGGSLENLINYDMALLRSNNYTRIDLDFFKFVYDLLNLRLMSGGVVGRKYLNTQSNGETSNHLAYIFKDSDSDFYGFSYDRNFSNFNVSSQQALDDSVSQFNASSGSYSTQTSLSSYEFINCVTTGSGGGSGTVNDSVCYIKYTPTGFDNNILDMDDLGVNLRSYGYISSRVQLGGYDFFNYLPKGDRVKGENNINPPVQTINSQKVIKVSSEISSNISSPTAPSTGDREEDQFSEGVIIPFLDFDIEGFLNYYTEPATP